MVLGHFEGRPDQFQAYELVPPLLKPCDDIPDQSTLNSVGLDGEEGPLFGRYLALEAGHMRHMTTASVTSLTLVRPRDSVHGKLLTRNSWLSELVSSGRCSCCSE